MSFSLNPYLINRSAVAAVVGSKDQHVVEILAAQAAETPLEPEKLRAVQALVDGHLNDPNISPEAYGYGFEVVCAALGQQPEVGFGLNGFSSRWLEEEAFEILDTLWQGDKWLTLPASEYGVPDVFCLDRPIMVERLKMFSSLDLSDREDAAEAVEEFTSWLRQAIAANSDMVVFWY